MAGEAYSVCSYCGGKIEDLQPCMNRAKDEERRQELLQANVNLRQKLEEKEKSLADMLEDLNSTKITLDIKFDEIENLSREVRREGTAHESTKTMLGNKFSEIESLKRELSQERTAYEQTRGLWKSAEKELVEIDDAFERCGNPVGAHDRRPEKIVNVLTANKRMAELIEEHKGKA